MASGKVRKDKQKIPTIAGRFIDSILKINLSFCPKKKLFCCKSKNFESSQNLKSLKPISKIVT